MDAAHERPSASFLERVVRWIGDLERAIELQPVDRLELRVAGLERQIAGLTEGDSKSGAPSALSTHQARKL